MNKIKIDNYYKSESKTLRLDELDYTIIPNSDIKPLLDKLQQENEQLKMIVNEYERLNKGFKITNVQKYNVDELLSYQKYKDNWNKLKEYIRKNIIYDDVGMKILDPSPLEDYMQELEQGSDSDV